MNITDRRNVSRAPETQGDEIQDPRVSSTSNIKPRIRNIRTDCIALYYPIPCTYSFTIPDTLMIFNQKLYYKYVMYLFILLFHLNYFYFQINLE